MTATRMIEITRIETAQTRETSQPITLGAGKRLFGDACPPAYSISSSIG